MKYLFYVNLILWVVACFYISFSVYNRSVTIGEIQKLEYKVTQAELKARKLEERAENLDLVIKALLESKNAN